MSALKLFEVTITKRTTVHVIARTSHEATMEAEAEAEAAFDRRAEPCAVIEEELPLTMLADADVVEKVEELIVCPLVREGPDSSDPQDWIAWLKAQTAGQAARVVDTETLPLPFDAEGGAL